jgi:hypothetical protein
VIVWTEQEPGAKSQSGPKILTGNQFNDSPHLFNSAYLIKSMTTPPESGTIADVEWERRWGRALELELGYDYMIVAMEPIGR